MNNTINAPQTRRRLLQLVATAPALAIAPRVLRAEPGEARGPTTPAPVSADDTTFEDVWQTVRDRFYDPHFHGLDWDGVRERYHSNAAQATSEEGRAAVINSMLSELHASHTHYYTPNAPEYYQLAERHVRFLAPLAFLSPRIVEAIAEGRAPGNLNVSNLARALPLNWREQEQRLALG